MLTEQIIPLPGLGLGPLARVGEENWLQPPSLARSSEPSKGETRLGHCGGGSGEPTCVGLPCARHSVDALPRSGWESLFTLRRAGGRGCA
jgi:hypothetical protein